MTKLKSLFLIFALANAAGATVYGFLIWRIIHSANLEQRPIGDGADGLAFLFSALPVLIAFLILNLAFLGVGAVRFRKYGDHRTLAVGCSVIGAWGAWVFFLPQML